MPAPWTEPRTWSFEEVVTAAQLNEQLRDNLKHIGPDSGTYQLSHMEDVTHSDHGAVGDGVADDTAAIQSAIDAVASAGGGIVFLPTGAYVVTSPLDFASAQDGLVLVGQGRTNSEIVSSSSNVVDVQGDQHVVQSVKFHSRPGGGHVFNQVGRVSRCVFRDVNVVQDNDGLSIWHKSSGVGSYVDNLWESFENQHTSSATVPSWNLVHTGTEPVNINKWHRFRHTFAGDYVWRIENIGSGSFASDNTWDHGNFEVCDHGVMDLKGVRSPTLRDLAMYDNGTIDKNSFRLVTSSGGADSSFATIEKVVRHGASLAAGVVDFEIDANIATTNHMLWGCFNSGGDGLSAEGNGKRFYVVGGNLTVNNDTRILRVSNSKVQIEETSIERSAADEMSLTAAAGVNLGSLLATGQIRSEDSLKTAWYVQLDEGSNPSAPTGTCRLYLFDNGGTQELRVHFANGTIKTVADDL